MFARSIRSIGMLAVFVLAAAACSSSGGTSAEPPDTPAIESPSTQPSEAPSPGENSGGGDNGGGGGGGNGGPVAEVLRFSAPRLSGGTLEGEDFAGRDVAIWFWAPW